MSDEQVPTNVIRLNGEGVNDARQKLIAKFVQVLDDFASHGRDLPTGIVVAVFDDKGMFIIDWNTEACALPAAAISGIAIRAMLEMPVRNHEAQKHEGQD